MTVDLVERKKLLRSIMKKSRAEVPQSRRINAALHANDHLIETFKSHPLVLSYSSFGDEFCTLDINKTLAKENKLALPRVVGQDIKVYIVKDLDEDLVKNKWGIMEPDPKCSEEACLTQVSLVLVPAIGFDKNNHRIGYGGGFYDRLLARFSSRTLFLGLGFKEQYSEAPIPSEPTDVTLSDVFLY